MPARGDSSVGGDASDLPSLEGSEKQVAWALRLRDKLIQTLEGEGASGMTPADVELCRSKLREATTARFFIDHRDDLAGALLGRRASGAARTEPSTGELPELTGTEKQVSWANRIRAEYLRKLDERARSAAQRSLQAFTAASFFIDNRDRLDEALGAGQSGARGKEPKLPPLDGTEKQVAWAERIRASFVATLTEDEARVWGKTIGALKEATFYIDHREDLREGIQSEIAEPGSSKKLRNRRYSSNWE